MSSAVARLLLLLSICSLTHAQEAPTTSIACREPQLRQELINRVKVDQDARHALIDWQKSAHDVPAGATQPAEPDVPRTAEGKRLTDAVQAADRENTKWLAQIVAEHGWPTISSVDRDGASAAWLLVQHADANPTLQRKCLDLMTALPKDEVSQTELAYLTDRVLLAEGKKQIYGTQFALKDGKWQPRDLEDPTNVDRRRREVGMQPLAEYAKQLEEMYGHPSGN